MIALTLCRQDNLCKELWGYARAFRRHGVTLECLELGTPLNFDISTLLKKLPARPDFILQPESDFNYLPSGLTQQEIPSVCFHFDTYHALLRRIRWSMLYDVPVLFHPHFADDYRRAGHPNPLTLAHAAQLDFYGAANLSSQERNYDVGWVGRLSGAPYDARRRILPQLAAQFTTNDFGRSYSLEDTAAIYRHSKIIVNISRDDYPQDANMRVYESMAAGALLITRMPTDLTTLGFIEGEHFIGYRNEAEIISTVRRFLADVNVRSRITSAARDLVLARHTYDVRVKKLLDFVSSTGARFAAPARRWPETKIRLTYLDYYAGTHSMGCAYKEFDWIARHSLVDSLAAARLLARSWARQGLNRVAAWSHR
jgi:Glycosyl transferases group 1